MILVNILAKQVIEGKIKLEQIGNGFNLHNLVKAKVEELTKELELGEGV